MSNDPDSINDILDTYREDRKSPRLVLACPLVLSIPGGEEVTATLYDITLAGLQAWIGISEADRINIQPGATLTEQTATLEAKFRVTVDGQVQEIRLSAKPLHLKKIHEDYLAVGMRITEMDKKDAETLGKIIEASVATP